MHFGYARNASIKAWEYTQKGVQLYCYTTLKSTTTHAYSHVNFRQLWSVQISSGSALVNIRPLSSTALLGRGSFNR